MSLECYHRMLAVRFNGHRSLRALVRTPEQTKHTRGTPGLRAERPMRKIGQW